MRRSTALMVTVSDDDDPGVTLSASTLTVAEGATGTYTVKLSVIPTADVTVECDQPVVMCA